MIFAMTSSEQHIARQTSIVDLERAIETQREMLTEMLTLRMLKMAKRLASHINQRISLEILLTDEFQQLGICTYLYVLDASGIQITANIARDGAHRNYRARNRSDRDYMQNIIGVSDFRLSETYISKNNRRPSITAIQVIRDQDRAHIGFIGADFDLRVLPHTGIMYNEISQWRQLRGDPAIRGGLFSQSRVHSILDQKIDDVMIQMEELITARGIFHIQLHFSSSRAIIWLTEDPYCYRLLGVDELSNPEICLAYSPQPYPDSVLVPASEVIRVLERFKLLRFMDENIYLRSGSLNIFNGVVGLNFSCDGSHYMNFQEFLEKDSHFWFGQRCVN